MFIYYNKLRYNKQVSDHYSNSYNTILLLAFDFLYSEVNFISTNINRVL